jgi:hypothetical protein
VGSTVEEICSTLVIPSARSFETPNHRSQEGRTFDHGRIYYLAPTGPTGLTHRTHYAEGEQHASAAEIAN